MLRSLEPYDVDLLYDIENNPEQWEVSSTNMPYSREFLANYILNTTGDIYTDRQLRLVVIDDNNEPSGLVDLQNFDPKHLRAEIGITILPHKRQQGLATQALHDLMVYARNTLHIHQLYAITAETNIPTLNLLHKCGFSNGKALEDWLFNGQKYVNAIFLHRFL